MSAGNAKQMRGPSDTWFTFEGLRVFQTVFQVWEVRRPPLAGLLVVKAGVAGGAALELVVEIATELRQGEHISADEGRHVL